MSDQSSAEVAAAADDDLLRGGKQIAKFLYRSDEPADVKRLYAEAPRLPVFQPVPHGPLHAFKSRLLKHYEALSAIKEKAIAEAAEQRLLGVDATPAKPRLKIGKPKRAAISSHRSRPRQPGQIQAEGTRDRLKGRDPPGFAAGNRDRRS